MAVVFLPQTLHYVCMVDSNLFWLIFSIVFMVVFFSLLLWSSKSGILPKRIRNWQIKNYVDEIIEDYGVVGETNLTFLSRGNGRQNVRLLKCKKGDDVFLVLETNRTGIGFIQTTWTKLDKNMLESIIDIYKKNSTALD